MFRAAILAGAVLAQTCTPAPAHEASARDERAAVRTVAARQSLEQKQAVSPRTRTLHPQPGSSDCIEMYGSCTPPPDQLCTSNAFALACGESGELPSSDGEREHIVCACP